jgi:hypothetical protein
MSAKITAALHAVMLDVPYVQKTGKNTFHNYRYAGEADLLEKLRPALLRHGLMLIPSAQEASPADQNGNVMVRVEYTLVHRDGDVWPDKIGAVGCGQDRSRDGKIGDKGVYKALTGANKYLLFKLFQIETGDDPEKDDHVWKGEYVEGPSQKPDPIEGYHPPGGRDSRSVYVENSLKLIEQIQTPEAVSAWLDREVEQGVWKQYGITEYQDDGRAILMACKKRRLELKEAA